MKRKLIKRNKQFLSSRYRQYAGGTFSFQILTTHEVYFDKDDNMVFKPRKYAWIWFLKGDLLQDILNDD